MSHSNPILNELKDLSEVVAKLPIKAPYQIPEKYFENLESVVMNRIKAMEPVINSTLLTDLKQSNPFTLPPSYFDEFPRLLLKHIKLDEATDQKEELELLSPLLLNLNKKVPFKLPDLYFEEFPSDIIAGVNAVDYVNQELEGQSTMLSDLKSINVYEVPEKYFDSMAETLLSTIKNHHRTPVISFFNKKVLRYAVAAVIGGIISVSAWMLYQSKPMANNELADIKKISNDEMINYLESASVTPVDNNNTAYILRADDVKELLSDISDEEMKRYLEQHAVSNDLTIN